MSISTIIKKDLYANLQDTKLQVLAITIICLTLLVSVLGTFEYKLKNERYLTEQASNTEQLYKNIIYGTIHPKAIKPPTPLAIFCKGVEQDFGNSYTFDLLTIPYTASKIYDSNSYIEGFINLDLSVVFIWLFSLISILIAYDCIVKERENGTLKLMFVSRLSKTKFLFSKMLSSFLSIFYLVVVSICIVAIVFLLSPWIEFNGCLWYSLFLFFILTLIFTVCWVAIALYFSIRFKTSSQALVASLAVWIILLLVFPTATKVFLGDTNFVNEKKEIALLEQDIMKEYYNKRSDITDKEIYPLIRDLQFSTFGGSPGYDQQPIWGPNPPTLQATIKLYNSLNPIKNDFAYRKFAIANDKYLIPLKNKILLYNRLAYFSPVSLFEYTSRKIARTSADDQFMFFDNFKIYRDQIIQFFNKRGAFNSQLWFMSEPEYYPYSPNHPLCPADPINPTEEELDKLRAYYSKVTEEEHALDLQDFPVFNITAGSENNRGILVQFLAFILFSSIFFLLSLHKMRHYNFE